MCSSLDAQYHPLRPCGCGCAADGSVVWLVNWPGVGRREHRVAASPDACDLNFAPLADTAPVIKLRLPHEHWHYTVRGRTGADLTRGRRGEAVPPRQGAGCQGYMMPVWRPFKMFPVTQCRLC